MPGHERQADALLHVHTKERKETSVSIIWFIVWLIADHIGDHEPLLFNSNAAMIS